MSPLSNTDNVTAWFHPATIVHRPTSTHDVVELVRAARSRKATLSPFSTGYNWGYGSRSPVLPGAELVDLSGMNRIRNAKSIGLSHPVAVIEPGVTQGQMYRWLHSHCPALTFNATGSATETSILGNALERGSGYVGPRVDDLFGLEFVTGTGEVISTGFRRLGEDSPLAHSHPYGLGPMLDGLCTQSNFVIVTSACFKLLAKRPVQAAVSISLSDESKLACLIDALAQLKRDRVLTTVTHLANKARSAFTLRPGVARYLRVEHGLSDAALVAQTERAIQTAVPASWSGLAGISGTAAQVRAAMQEIVQRLRPFAVVRLVTGQRLNAATSLCKYLSWWAPGRVRAAALAAIRPLHGLVLGEPTDAPVQGLLERFGAPDWPASALDNSRCGLIYVNPALPLNGQVAADTVAGLTEVAKSFGHELFVTVNIETDSSMVAVTNILFDRSLAQEVDGARRCAHALYREIRLRGLEVYRARPDLMAEVTSQNPEYWQLIASLKRVFDPDNMIAPGRYCPADIQVHDGAGQQ